MRNYGRSRQCGFRRTAECRVHRLESDGHRKHSRSSATSVTSSLLTRCALTFRRRPPDGFTTTVQRCVAVPPAHPCLPCLPTAPRRVVPRLSVKVECIDPSAVHEMKSTVFSPAISRDISLYRCKQLLRLGKCLLLRSYTRTHSCRKSCRNVTGSTKADGARTGVRERRPPTSLGW